TGAPERVGADPHAGGPDRVDVEHRGQVVDVGGHVVVPAGGVGGERPLVRNPFDLLEPTGYQRVRAVLDPLRRVGVGRAAVRRVVLEPAVLGRVVRGCDDDAVGQTRRAPAVVGED